MKLWWVPWVYGTTCVPFVLCLNRYVRVFWGRRSPVRTAMLTLFGSLVAVLGYATLATALDLPFELRAVLMLLLLGGVQAAGWMQYVAMRRTQRQPHPAAHVPEETT